ncbi:hypothetical protein BKA64DRAFT_246767 [Cadophora sp. MPI-SDFR-AT-0126]|nr:hypothetical protein BKA64DRAFT_246767 [Leotiomycetes sp. MPI-SDFR-AT-0126]
MLFQPTPPEDPRMWDASDPINFDLNNLDFFSLPNDANSQAAALNQPTWWNSPLLPPQGFIEDIENVENDDHPPMPRMDQGPSPGSVSNSFDVQESQGLNVTLQGSPVYGDTFFADSSTPGTESTGRTGTTSPVWTPKTPVTPEERASKSQANLFIQVTPEQQVKRKRPAEWTRRTKNKRQRGQTARKDVMHNDLSPKSVERRDAKGNLQGVFRNFGLNQRIRTSMEPAKKKATALTRIMGACQRCQMRRSRCDRSEDLYQPCASCAATAVGLLRQPCVHFDVLDLNLNRLGSTLNNDLHYWSSRKEQLQTMRVIRYLEEYEAPQTILLTQDAGTTLSVTVSRFHPEPGDTTGYKWSDSQGNPRVMEMPPYHICDMNKAIVDIQDYCARSRSLHIESLLSGANPIIWKTFHVAFEYISVSKSTLVSNALSFWVATRLTEKPWRICGEQTLGLLPRDEPDNPWNGIIPVTPIMDTELDDIVIRGQLLPLRQMFLTELKQKIDERKRENWLEIYLSMFIMMCNVEWILKDVVEYTTRHSMVTSSQGGASLSQGYIHACKTMLAYFHHACQGSLPLSITLDESNADFHGMSPEELEYLRSIRNELTRQEDKLKGWQNRSMYNTEMYWCYQLFTKGWRGDTPHAGPIDAFTEEDFLTS